MTLARRFSPLKKKLLRPGWKSTRKRFRGLLAWATGALSPSERNRRGMLLSGGLHGRGWGVKPADVVAGKGRPERACLQPVACGHWGEFTALSRWF